MPGGSEGTPWPEPGEKAPFTWGTASDGPDSPDGPEGPSFTWGAPPARPSYTWGAPSGGPTPPAVRYAPWGRRAGGFLMDFILMLSAPLAFFVAFAVSVPETADPNPPMSVLSWVWFWCLMASFTVFVLYPVWFIERRGQTPGMRQMEIRLFRIDGEGNLEAPSSARAWGRAVTAAAGWFVFFAWILDYLWPLGDTRRQCIHDKIAGTVAVDVRSEGVVRHEVRSAPANDPPSG